MPDPLVQDGHRSPLGVEVAELQHGRMDQARFGLDMRARPVVRYVDSKLLSTSLVVDCDFI